MKTSKYYASGEACCRSASLLAVQHRPSPFPRMAYTAQRLRNGLPTGLLPGAANAAVRETPGEPRGSEPQSTAPAAPVAMKRSDTSQPPPPFNGVNPFLLLGGILLCASVVSARVRFPIAPSIVSPYQLGLSGGETAPWMVRQAWPPPLQAIFPPFSCVRACRRTSRSTALAHCHPSTGRSSHP